MEGRTKGVFAQWKEEQKNEALKEGKKEGIKEGKKEGIKEGIIIGEKNIIQELLKNYTMEETSKLINKNVSEIEKIMSID